MNLNEYFHYFLGNRELNELYASISIRSFAISLIGVFVPIYLYTLGNSFSSIFLFYIFWSLTHLLFAIPSAKISSRFGLKHSILFSVPFYIVFFLLLYSIEDFNWPLLILPIFLGLSSSLFWTSYHTDFAKFSDKKNRGKEIGFSNVLVSIFSVLGPLIGGIILTFLGFKLLFVIVSLLLLSSVMPLFLSNEVYEPSPFSVKGFFRGQKIRDILSFLGHGIENKLGAVVWPLFIFIFIFSEEYLSLGFVSSLTLGFSFVFTFVVGKFADAHRRKIMRIGSIFNAGIWIIKSFIVTPLQVFIADSFYGASRTTMNIPFDALNYDKAKRESLTRMILEREIYHHLGVILLFLFLILFVESITEIFRYAGPLSSLLRFFF